MATIQEVYIALFGRPADPIGLRFYNEATDNGNNLDAVGALTGSDEYLDRFEGQNDVQMINQIFQDLFGRDADASGLLFYTQLLQSGQASIQDIAIRIIDGATGSDQAIVDAKVAAADLFTASLDQGTEIVAYSGQEGIDFGQNYLAGVTSAATVPTQAQVDAQIAAFVTGDPTAPTNQINFTNAIGEQLVGTAENDAFNGVASATAANGTINVGDTVNGGAGVDTLNILVSDATALPAGFSSTGVEIVNINYAGATSLGALNSSSFGGVQQLWQIDNDTAAAGTFQNVTVASGVTAGFRSTGNGATAAAATATVTAAAGVTSAAIALDGIDDGSTITLAETTANGLSTVSVSGSVATTAATPGNPGAVPPVAPTPATSQLTLASTAGDVDNLNLDITSNTTVVISALDDLNTIDASGSTGNLTVALGTPDELASATFGTGNDTVSINTSGLLAATPVLTIDLGAGNDVITVTGAGNAAATAVNVTLGEGNDTFAVGATLTNVTSAASFAADLITVTDFNAAQDVLDLSALGPRDVIINTEQANISAAASLEAALAVAAAATATGSYSVFNYGDDAYVLNNLGGQGFTDGDGLVKITGFSVEDITAQNFIA